MKQTAVEWQFEQLFNSFEKFNNGECTFNDYLKRNLEIREQAKEMEKNQLSHFYSCGTFDEYSRNVRNAEELYNETFKQQEQ